MLWGRICIVIELEHFVYMYFVGCSHFSQKWDPKSIWFNLHCVHFALRPPSTPFSRYSSEYVWSNLFQMFGMEFCLCCFSIARLELWSWFRNFYLRTALASMLSGKSSQRSSKYFFYSFVWNPVKSFKGGYLLPTAFPLKKKKLVEKVISSFVLTSRNS